MLTRRRNKTLAAVVLGVGIVSATYGLTAANTVPATKAGDGSGAVSGYAVSSVHYGLNASDPTKVDSVAFTLDSAPVAGSTIKIKLEAAGSTWYSCALAGANATCATTAPQATVAPVDQLRVVVAD